MRLPSLGFRFRPGDLMMILVGAAAVMLTLELGRQRRIQFRGVARRLAIMEKEALVQAGGAASSAGYHRRMVAHGGFDPQTVKEWQARVESLDRVADDWRRQAESFRRSERAYEHAALSWLPVEPD